MRSIASRVRRHLDDSESHHRKIAVGVIWVGLFAAIGKMAGAAKEMAIALRYGVSEAVDAYVFIFNLVTWPVSVWFSVLTVVLVPIIARLRHDSPGELLRFRGQLLGLTLIIGLGMGILAWFGLPALLKAGWLGLSDKALTKALQMCGGLTILAPIGTVISFLSAWMLACGRHLNTLFEAIPALIILAALLLPLGLVAEPLLWGTVAGFALHAAALAGPLQKRGELQAPSFGFSSTAWQGFWSGAGIVAVGQALSSLVSVIDQFFAAGLGPGALSTLSYANRCLALLLGMGAMAISRATLPVFSELNARRDTNVNILALRWVKWMFSLGAVVLVIGWVFSPLMVEVLFERGMFSNDDTRAVSSVLQIALIQTPFYFSSLVLVQYLSSIGSYFSLLLLGGLGLVMKLACAWLLSPIMGWSGLVLSTAFVFAINAAIMAVISRKPI